MQRTVRETDRQAAEALRAEKESRASGLTTASHASDVSALPRLLSEAEAAQHFRISVVTLRRIRARGEIAHIWIGGKAKYTEQHLLDYLAARSVPPKEKEVARDTKPRAPRLHASVSAADAYKLAQHIFGTSKKRSSEP